MAPTDDSIVDATVSRVLSESKMLVMSRLLLRERHRETDRERKRVSGSKAAVSGSISSAAATAVSGSGRQRGRGQRQRQWRESSQQRQRQGGLSDRVLFLELRPWQRQREQRGCGCTRPFNGNLQSQRGVIAIFETKGFCLPPCGSDQKRVSAHSRALAVFGFSVGVPLAVHRCFAASLAAAPVAATADATASPPAC